MQDPCLNFNFYLLLLRASQEGAQENWGFFWQFPTSLGKFRFLLTIPHKFGWWFKARVLGCVQFRPCSVQDYLDCPRLYPCSEEHVDPVMDLASNLILVKLSCLNHCLPPSTNSPLLLISFSYYAGEN